MTTVIESGMRSIVAAIILSVWAVTAEAADEKCFWGFQGCVDASSAMYVGCLEEGDCEMTLEEAKAECMKRYPDCADRAYVEDRFKELLKR